MVRILVTGADGYLGSAFSNFAKKYAEIIPLKSSANFMLPYKIPPLKGFSYAVHFAALTDARAPKQELYAVNAEGTLKLLENLEQNSPELKRIIYLSSGGVYGYGEKPFTEKSKTNPHNEYTSSKLEGEKIVNSFKNLNATILRIFFPYGRDKKGERLVSRLAKNIRDHKTISLNKGARPYLNPVHIDDVSSGVLKALWAEDKRFEIYNLAGADRVNIRELAENIGSFLQKKPFFEETENECKNMIGNISKARKNLDFCPISLENGLTEEFG